MPLKVEDLKKLSKDLCYVVTRVKSPLRIKLVEYLKGNIGTAYTTGDLVPIYREFRGKILIQFNEEISKISDDNKLEKRRLRKRFLINDGGQKIKAQIHRSLKAEIDTKNPCIKKKGSYYWYEK